MKKLIFFLLFLSSNLFAQDRKRIDSLFLSKIPYDAERAERDIENGEIRVIQLLSLYTIEDYFSEPYEIEYVEKKYGFRFHYEQLDIFQNYLDIKQRAYNQVVYTYLDEQCNCDSKSQIFGDLRKMAVERWMKNRRKNKKKLKKQENN